jgi:MFS family permease
MLALLRQRNFGLLWWGGLISFIGDWVLFVTLPLYIYNLTGSVLAMGGMFLVGRLPSILLGSFAGVYVDRWDRKWTLVISSLLLGPLLMLLLLFQSPDQVWIVYLVSLVSNTIRQFSTPAENALLPQLVEEDQLITANALNSLNNNLARLIGPAVGGLVYAALGYSAAILVDVASFIIAGLMIALIAAPSSVTRPQHDHAEEGAAKRNVWLEWVDGLRVVRRNHVVSSLFIVMGISMFAEGILGVLMFVFVQESLRGGAIELGWLLTAQAVGGLLGGLFIGRLGKRYEPWKLVAVGFMLMGLIDLLIFTIPVLAVGLVLFIVVGIPITGLQAGSQTLFQTSVADRYRGRVMGAFGTTGAILLLAGTAIASTLGNAGNVVWFLSAVAILDFLAGVAAWFLFRRGEPASTPRPTVELAQNTAID